MRNLLLAIALLALCAVPAAAESCREKCESQSSSCLSGAGDDQKRSECDTTRNSCNFVCGSDDGGGTSGPPRPTQFGAIAYSPSTGGRGYTYNYNARATAENDAVAYCRKDSGDAGDCRVAVWFYNACGALARASDGSWGAEIGYSRSIAQGLALATCTHYGGKDCRIISWACAGV